MKQFKVVFSLIATLASLSQTAWAGEQKEKLFESHPAIEAGDAFSAAAGMGEVSVGLLGFLPIVAPDAHVQLSVTPFVRKEADLLADLKKVKSLEQLDDVLRQAGRPTLNEAAAKRLESTSLNLATIRDDLLVHGWEKNEAAKLAETLTKKGLLKRMFWVGGMLYLVVDGLDRTQLAASGHDTTFSPLFTRALAGAKSASAVMSEDIFEDGRNNSNH